MAAMSAIDPNNSSAKTLKLENVRNAVTEKACKETYVSRID